ncbi:pectinesterase family protein [Joostella sp. CR20]|uniref:pectinesterase family protein n=1 Tax=Joostella sp. CR20 TaxID=2804312 RepID=UPI00313D848B
MLSTFLSAQQLAFPTAEGFGRYATGGRGGQVYVVTNLNDSGEGSLRKGILKSGPRTIVFAVSGNITLQSDLDINKGDLTILGQTAPGDGITIKGYPVSVKADNVIIRYMRFRMGDEFGVEDDALGGRNISNVIIDHCSISWSTDENVSFYNTRNFTMQWCIISEALNRSVHKKGAHGYGGIWGGVNASFHHNLIVSNSNRNPRFSGSSSTKNSENEFVDFRNNVIYNWKLNNIYGGEKGSYNVVNNYLKPGPATSSDKKDRILNPYEPYGKFFLSGNFLEGNQSITNDNWLGVIADNPSEAKLSAPIKIDNIETQSAEQAYALVLKNAGASKVRDAVDLRIVSEVKNGTTTYKNGIIDSQNDVGGWPVLKEVIAEKDTDKDGIPDTWEQLNKLETTKEDAHLIDASTNYSNIEVYANSLLKNSVFDFVVSADGTGNFTSVQQAIDAVPNFRKKQTRIFIKNGVYKEKLVLPASKTNVAFIGEDKEKTILTFDDYASKHNAFGEEMGTTGSTSFFIFGNDFYAENITFENSAGPVGQAVAVRVDGDRVFFNNCKFLGNQDTLYLHGKESRQYYKDCYIEGTVDFIFGWSTAFFENCTIVSKDHGYVTAASTEKDTKYGMVFYNCKLLSKAEKHSFYLGRPWRDYAQTVWIDCYMENHIKPEGWHNWSKPHAEQTTFYAEYNTSGPGASTKRVPWAKSLTKEQATNFNKINVLSGTDNWNP